MTTDPILFNPDRPGRPPPMSLHPHRHSLRHRLSTAWTLRRRGYLDRSLVWRVVTPVVFVATGVLFVTSLVSSGGTDLRAGRYTDLGGLASAEAKHLSALQERSAALQSQVDSLTQDLGMDSTRAAQKRVDRLAGPVGLLPEVGPGVTITLDDASNRALDAAGSDVTDLIVHQQDIQAVANALWAGGAEAMTIAGERVVATTGIKCVGNTVVLHGVPLLAAVPDLRDRSHRLDDGLGEPQPLHRPLPRVGGQGPGLERDHFALPAAARVPRVDRPGVRDRRAHPR